MRSLYNQGIAVDGANGSDSHGKARKVEAAYTALELLGRFKTARNRAGQDFREELMRRAKDQIYTYVEDALRTRNGEPLRLLADLVDNKGVKSLDAFALIEFCLTKPHTYRFTFKELRDGYAKSIRLKPPYDENITKRLRRLIRIFGIKTRKGQ